MSIFSALLIVLWMVVINYVAEDLKDWMFRPDTVSRCMVRLALGTVFMAAIATFALWTILIPFIDVEVRP